MLSIIRAVTTPPPRVGRKEQWCEMIQLYFIQMYSQKLLHSLLIYTLVNLGNSISSDWCKNQWKSIENIVIIGELVTIVDRILSEKYHNSNPFQNKPHWYHLSYFCPNVHFKGTCDGSIYEVTKVYEVMTLGIDKIMASFIPEIWSANGYLL